MSLGDDIKDEVARIFRERWTTRDGYVVPEPEDLKLSNNAVKLKKGTVLYADLAASTELVDTKTPEFAAEIYKTYLFTCAKIIRSEGGTITSYDGDRIMAVYLGDDRNTEAVRTGLKINWAVKQVINPALKNQYPDAVYEVQQTVGIDTSSLFVARTGIRNSNDLVWVGRAANYAAKLTTLPSDHPTWITEEVYDDLQESAKTTNGKSMWEQRLWTAMNKKLIYRSNWTWRIS